ncbi:MAG: DUF2326 domain-containing protein [Gammaproteobacteria bacterium]|nr:DUF2326 domain-containing protein [Gammaproteobacteria bacterium]
MIRAIESDLESFKALTFKSGLNILLADKSEGASDRQSRNGAGKTSLIELIHFLCGADARPNSVARSHVLVNSTFKMTMGLNDSTITIARCGNNPSKLGIYGAVDALTAPLISQKLDGCYEISNENWKTNLAACWFGIEPLEDSSEKRMPSFRSLFSYFVRRQGSNGFQTPVKHTGQQQTWDQQVAISFLLGLNWRISSEIQGLKDREKVIKGLAQAAKSGDLDGFVGHPADLRTELAIAENNAEELSHQIHNFQVIPQYQELQAEANEITAKINLQGEENFVDRRLVANLEESLAEEQEPSQDDLVRLYEEAGITLPDVVRRRLDDAKVFHHTIVKNRRSHLGAEIDSAKQRIQQREKEQTDLDERRRQVMEILRSGGALEQYTAIREELGRAQGNIETMRQRLMAAEELERSKAELNIERTRLARALSDDIHERDNVLKEAILTFEGLSRALYEEAGSLIIDATKNGPRFEVKIARERSKGITNMQIFCFDWMLAELISRRGKSPGFLVHDSHIFDGVDKRQIVNALQLGAQKAEELGLQYIVTMNSDALPKSGYQNGFDIHDYVLPVRLTDATDTGGLFGLRF